MDILKTILQHLSFIVFRPAIVTLGLAGIFIGFPQLDSLTGTIYIIGGAIIALIGVRVFIYGDTGK